MAHEDFSLSSKIAAVGLIVFSVAILTGVTTNCSWRHHAFCDDKAATELVNVSIFATGVLSVLTFLIGGAMREINMEAKLSPPEVDEARIEYEEQSITRRPFVPNLMIVVGLILAFGMSVTILGAVDGGQRDSSFYSGLDWLLLVSGLTMVFAGYYLKRKQSGRAPISLDSTEANG